MEILKKIIISNNKRPILLQTESRNSISLSKANTSKTNLANNNIYNKSSYANIQNSKMMLKKNIPKSKMNISFFKKSNEKERNKDCKLISYIDLGSKRNKKFIKLNKDKLQASKSYYTFKKDLVINNNITNNISNHITNIILTNNNSHLGKKNLIDNKKPNRVDNKNLLLNKNNETNNNLGQKLQKKKRIIKNTKLERNSYNKIQSYKCDLTSRNTKNSYKRKEINLNSIKIISKKLNFKEKENKTKNIFERNKNSVNTYFTSYINSSSPHNNNIKSKLNIPKNNKSRYKNATNNIEIKPNIKKYKQKSLNKANESSMYNSNSNNNLIKFNPSMKYLEDSFLSFNSLNSNTYKMDNDKMVNNSYQQYIKINNNNSKYIYTKIQKQYKTKLKININDIKNINQMRTLFDNRISNANTNKSLGEKNKNNITYINSSVTLRGNMKSNNSKKIKYTLIHSNSKNKQELKTKSKESKIYKYKNKNDNELMKNIYKNYKTDRSFGNNNTYTNDENSNINIINIINNFNKKNNSYNKSFLANNPDILKNKTFKGQKRKISLNIYKNIKKYFLSKSLKNNLDNSNTYANIKNDNYNSYREQYLYNKANSYRNINYISKEKDKKNYTKRKKPKYYSNQKKIHNKKIIINRKKNRCKKGNMEYFEFKEQKNDLVNLINLKKNNILKKKLLIRNPNKSLQNYKKDVCSTNNIKNGNRNTKINYSKDTRDTYNSISMNVLKDILGMNSDRFSPREDIKSNLIKSYNINGKIIEENNIIKQNKSFKMSNPFNNITSLNKKKKIKIDDILHNKNKNKNSNKYNKWNKINKDSKIKKKNEKSKEEIEKNSGKIVNKENEIKSQSKDKISVIKYFGKSKTNQNININKNEINLNKEINEGKKKLERESTINLNIKNNPQYLPEYIYDILENFLLDESWYITKNYINPNYLFSFNEDIELTPEIRSISINWLIMINYKIFKFKENTLFLTVQIIDRFLSKKMISVERVELLILCALILSSKHEEIDYVNMVESLQLSSNKFTKEEIINMQYEILNFLNFELIIPTMNDYYAIYCTILNIDEIDINKGIFLLNIVLVDYHIIKYANFIISLAVVKLINKKSINTIIERLRYLFIKNKQDIFLDMINNEKYFDKICNKIKKIYKKYIENKYKNIEEKFSDKKYNSVANISSNLIDISDI